MNIGFITPQISLSMGGIQNMSYHFVGAFSEQCDFRVFCSKDSDDVEGYDNVTYSKYKQDETFGLHGELIKNTFSAHKQKAFDFTFASLYPYGLACYFLKKLKGVPYGILTHGNELMLEPERKGIKGKIIGIVKQRLKRIILENADVVFANSNYTKELFLESYSAKKVVVIHPPVKYVDRHVDVENEKKNYVLLSIGRIIERKGFQYAIDAMSELIKAYPQLKYYIAGDGPYADTLKQKTIELGLEEHVFLLGRISEEEKDRLYRECDCFIMPSYTIKEDAEVEGFGIVFIEANMYGKYVIGTREGGIPDAIIEGKTGSFVKSQDVDSLIEKINKIYSKSFSYSPEECILWSKMMDASSIANQYMKAINGKLGGAEVDK